MSSTIQTPAGAAMPGEVTPLDPIELYRTMLTARSMNELLKRRKTQGKFPFYIGCGGHETMAAVAACLNDDDWMALYYRDLAAWLQRTKDIYGPLREAYSRVTGPMCQGRNMPSHYSRRDYNIMPSFSEVAALTPFAGGVAYAFKRHGDDHRIVMACTGDGGVATNDFNVLLRQATVHQLPVLMVIEDNGWAITTPQNGIQWAGSLVDIARAATAHAVEVDGSDPWNAYEAARELVDYVRAGKGPALLHLKLGLLDPHSSSTDIKAYRSATEIEETFATKDSVKNFGQRLVHEGRLTEDDLARMQKEVTGELNRAEAEVLKEPEPTAERVMQFVLCMPETKPIAPQGERKKMNMLAAINDALVELARRDADFFVYGQDVGSPRGGVFGATQALVNEFPDRAISSPLNEQLIVGIAAGAGMADGRPRCAEIQFVDYHQSATQTIRMAARISYQSCGDWTCPVIIRTKSGSGGGGPISASGSGGGAFGHSNAGEQWFTNIPGMITLCPATPYDAKGLLLAAYDCQSPVTYLERGRLYRSEVPKAGPQGGPIPQLAEFWEVPISSYTEPIGKARRLRFGTGQSQAAIIAWGTMVLEAAIAATRFVEEMGKGAVEVVDLRTLAPFDTEAVAAAVREANRVIVLTEEPDLTSFGRHVHSWITQNCFWDLDCTPSLIAAAPAPAAPYNEIEEKAFYPTAQDVQEKLEELMEE
jgi:2-oxoisovalerate dehydrogenase E1 component